MYPNSSVKETHF